jgi:glycosyltransferase involved in cell wall biosynthesis
MNNSHPKVTVLVPSYNHGEYIRQRIESICNQTYKNIELIVIDDASQDDSSEIISSLRSNYNFTYIQREKNSGTPFSAWEDICRLATGEFIWICESDDVAAPTFLEIAVASLIVDASASMFYCSSLVIDKNSTEIGHTDNYFHDTWKETRWDTSFSADGNAELQDYQIKGQTVPNMSSALFTTQAFKAAFTPFIKQLRLTGDWLFVGEIMKQGRVIFNRTALSYFREHEVTSRVRVQSARSQAEFIITKYRLFHSANLPVSSFATIMSSDVIRFLYEPDSWFDVLKELLQVSWSDAIRVMTLLIVSTASNTAYINKFKERYKHAKHL